MPDDGALGTVERVLALKKVPPFAELHPADLAPLAACALPRMVPAGGALPSDGDGGSVHVLLEGCIRERGRRHEAPALLGVLDVLAGDLPVDRVALVESRTLELTRKALFELIADEFEVWLATLRHVCGQLPRGGVPGAVCVRTAGAVEPRAAAPADLADRIASLRRVAAFADLGIRALGQIAGELQELTLPPGAVLWRRDDAAGQLLAIAAGIVRCTERAGSARDAGPGSLLGLTESLCAGRFDYRAEARSTVRALRIGVDALVDVLEDDPEAGVELLCVIARGRGSRATPGGVGDDE